LFRGRVEGDEFNGCGYLFEHGGGGFLDFFGLWDEVDGVGHWDNGDLSE
jgi:hypothetical protein